jgi:hypothetical protein
VKVVIWLMGAGFVAFGVLSTLAHKRRATRLIEL